MLTVSKDTEMLSLCQFNASNSQHTALPFYGEQRFSQCAVTH